MKDIKIRTSEEIETITTNTVTVDKAITAAILEIYEHKPVNDGKVKITISDYCIFDADAFKAENGEEEYNKYKTKPVHKEQVSTK